jgi:DNA-directed RNA polymerase specialized sigma24 family protein
VKSVAKEGLTHFATTRWSLIRPKPGGENDSTAGNAFAELCQIYWRPIFTFILRRGYPATDAQDLTQDFFVAVFNGKFVESANPNRGRFRSLLLTALKNFLIDQKVKSSRRKRGGGIEFVPFDKLSDETFQCGVSAGNGLATYPDEAVFDVEWAATVAAQALRQLREECESRGHRLVFECLRDYLAIERADTSYRHLSIALGMSEPSVKRLLHQFRARYRILVREQVAQTVESQAEVDTEIRYLCTVLAARPL